MRVGIHEVNPIEEIASAKGSRLKNCAGIGKLRENVSKIYLPDDRVDTPDADYVLNTHHAKRKKAPLTLAKWLKHSNLPRFQTCFLLGFNMVLNFDNMEKQDVFSVDLSVITMEQEHREALREERAKVEYALVADIILDTPYLASTDLY